MPTPASLAPQADLPGNSEAAMRAHQGGEARFPPTASPILRASGLVPVSYQ